jgi:hypothetical protein
MVKPLRETLKIILDTIPKPKKVLEIGSRQTANQRRMANLRSLLPGCEYIGVDMIKGPGVDMVVNANKLPFKDGEFDLVICLETFEHAEKPWLVAGEIQRVLGRHGIAIVSSQQNFPIHLHPSDYFRYTPFGLRSLFGELKNNFVVAISPPFMNEVKLNPRNVCFVGTRKRYKFLLEDIKRNLLSQKRIISVHKPWRHRLQDGIKFILRGLQETGYREEIEFF